MRLIIKNTVITLFSCLLFYTASAQNSDKYLVILSMDGFRWDMCEKANTPTLDSVRSVGVFSEIYPCYPANTFPNHYSMATGLHPDHHGIVNNHFYDKKLGKHFSISNKESIADPDFWGGEPIWNTVERQGLKAHIYCWPGSECEINGRYATVWTPYEENIPFKQRADWVLEALRQPEDEIPNLIMWYCEEPDLIGHRHSLDSPQAIAKVEDMDEVLRYFLDSVKSSPVYDKINFIFTADHGMTELSPERYVNLYSLLDSDKVKYSFRTTPLLLEIEEDYLFEAERLVNTVENVRAHRRETVTEYLMYGTNTDRITNLVVMPEIGWIADYSEVDKPKTGGGHGFSPFERDMHMVFFACGPDFKEAYIQESFQNLEIYRLIAFLLGVEPAENDGYEDIWQMLSIPPPTNWYDDEECLG